MMSCSCPGSVIILFRLANKQVYLHTGDFRACTDMELYPPLQSLHINQLYLDTTCVHFIREWGAGADTGYRKGGSPGNC